MNNSIFNNSEVQNMLKKYSKKQMQYIIKGVKKQPFEIWKEVENDR